MLQGMAIRHNSTGVAVTYAAAPQKMLSKSCFLNTNETQLHRDMAQVHLDVAENERVNKPEAGTLRHAFMHLKHPPPAEAPQLRGTKLPGSALIV